MLRFPTAGVSLHLGFFIITIAPLSHLSEGACALPDTSTWKPQASLEAALSSGSAKFTLPHIGTGFNRTVDLDGFENLNMWLSKKFSSDAASCGDSQKGEFIAKVTDQENGVFLRFANINCPLSAVALRKTPGEKYEAQIRFQFEWCKAAAGTLASPVSSAAVVLGLEPTAIDTKKLNMMPWLNEICNVKPTESPTAQITVAEQIKYLKVGNGTCKAQTSEAVSGKTTLAACRAACEYERKEKELVENKPDAGCSGFAFKAGAAPECYMYKDSEITELANQDNDWICESIEESTPTDYNKTSAAASPMDTAELSQSLHFSSAMDPEAMNTAKMYQIDSEEVPPCFPSSVFFMIQDEHGVPAALPIIQSQWQQFLDKLPEPPAAPNNEDSARRLTDVDDMNIKVTVDRVLVVAKNPADLTGAELNKEGWDRKCIEQEVPQTCDSKHIANSIVTGITVPCIGWAIVWIFYKRLLPASCMQNAGSRTISEPGSFDEGNVPTCQLKGLLASCLVALVSCAGLGIGMSILIEFAFGAEGCLHGEREMWVIALATAIPAGVSMCVGLTYMCCSGRKHSESSGNSRHYDPPKGKHLMLVEVPDVDGSSAGLRGEPLNPDILLTGNSAMASYRSGHGTSIQIHSPNGNEISAYQSMNQSSAMSTMRPRGPGE